MWIIEFLPEAAIHIIFSIGVIGIIVGLIAGFISSIKQYKLIIQIVSVLMLSLGLFLEGGLADTKEWQLKILELQVRVKESETASAQENARTQDKTIAKTESVREKTREVIKYVNRDIVKREEVVKYVERCALPQDVVDAHNRAVDDLNKAGGK